MTERTVAVRLRMLVRDYTTGAGEAERMTRRLTAAQEQLSGRARQSGVSMTRAAKEYEDAAGRINRATLLTSSALSAAGGGVQLLAPALTAAVAAGGALPGVLGGAAAAVGTLKVATIGVSDAVGDLFTTDDPFSRLSPSARALVQQIGVLKPQLVGLQQTLQDQALLGAAGNLDRLARDTLPLVSTQAGALADDWADMFTALTDAATDPQIQGAFTTVTNSADQFFDQFNTRVVPATRAFASIAAAADPLVRAVGDRLVTAVDRFAARVETARQSGNLADVFEAGAESADALLRIAGDVTGIIGRVIGQVNEQNNTIVGAADSLDAYLASGRGAQDITGIVDTLTTAYQGMSDVLTPLGQVTRDALADPGTREALANMFEVLAAGTQTIKVVFDLFNALPDGIQATILTVVALGAVATKTVGTVTAMGVAAQTAATRVATLGAAGATASKGMTGLAAGAGKAVTALAALQIAGLIFEEFEPAAADVDALTRSLEDFAATGEASGELARVFGADVDNFSKLAAAAGDGAIPKLGRSIESVIPPVKSLNEIFQGGSFTGAQDRFRALDSAIAQYARTTNDSAAVTRVWDQVLAQSGLNADELARLLPATIGEMTRLRDESANAAGGLGALRERTELLGQKMTDAVTAGRSLIDVFNQLNGAAITSAEAQIQAEEAVDALSAALTENGRALNKQGTDFDVTNAKGRENKQLTLDLIQAGAQAAQARLDEGGSVEQAAAVYNRYVEALRATLKQHGLAPPVIDAIIGRYAQMPGTLSQAEQATQALNAEIAAIPGATTFTVTGAGVVVASKNVSGLSYQIRTLPSGRTVIIGANTAEAQRDLRAAKAVLDSLRSKNITVGVRWQSNGDLKLPGGTSLKNAAGGVYQPMAAGGLSQPRIYPASNPPLYQFAEPETGGELFLPRRGNRERGRALLETAAAWYGGRFIAAAAGYATPGVAAAASGLVTIGAPAGQSMSTVNARLESIEGYIQARDAVARLSAALRENGRSFSFNTAKGRENYQQVISVVRAAQDAARAKYAETGSVQAANAEYDKHINALRATLAQQKVSASTVSALLRDLSRRPVYGDGTGVGGSSAAIAYAEAEISAQNALARFTDTLSLNRPVFSTTDEAGRDNLTALFGLLKAAQQAAEDKLVESGSTGAAQRVYEGYITQLRAILSAAGLPKASVDALLGTYGRITLTPNATGGVYAPMAVGGLGGGQVFPSGQGPLYGFAEPGTGGELFLPRLGSRRRGEDLLTVGAGWYGGRYLPTGSSGDTEPVQVTNNLNVYPQQTKLGPAELQWAMRQLDSRARTGRKG